MAWPPPLPLDNGHAQSVVICAILFPTISTLCVTGRFAARRIKKVSLGLDDWLTLPALLAVYAQMVIILLSVYYGGVGHHIQDLNDENVVAFYELIAAVQFSFGSSLGLAKISICLLLMRIFIDRTFRRAAWCVLVYCTCWMTMVISIGAGLCRPFAYNWDKSIKGGKCGELDPAYISIAVLDILGDAMIIALPMHSIWKIQTSLSTRIALSAVFALGFCDIIVAILRIIYLSDTDFSPNSDFTWASTGTYIWSVIESSLGVTVACSPVLRPLFYPWLPNLKSSIYSLAGSFIWRKGHRNEAYSDISNGELPLRDLGAFNSTAGSGNSTTFHTGCTAGATAATPDLSTHEEGSEPHTIHVKNEVSVRSLAKSSGQVIATV